MDKAPLKCLDITSPKPHHIAAAWGMPRNAGSRNQPDILCYIILHYINTIEYYNVLYQIVLCCIIDLSLNYPSGSNRSLLVKGPAHKQVLSQAKKSLPFQKSCHLMLCFVMLYYFMFYCIMLYCIICCFTLNHDRLHIVASCIVICYSTLPYILCYADFDSPHVDVTAWMAPTRPSCRSDFSSRAPPPECREPAGLASQGNLWGPEFP